MKMKWASEYNTGIDVIDEQHKRILDYINEIDDVKMMRVDVVLKMF